MCMVNWHNIGIELDEVLNVWINVSLNNGKVVWFVILIINWHQLNELISIVSISINDFKDTWLVVILIDWHSLDKTLLMLLMLSHKEVKLVKTNRDVYKTEISGSLGVGVKGGFWVDKNWETLHLSLNEI